MKDFSGMDEIFDCLDADENLHFIFTLIADIIEPVPRRIEAAITENRAVMFETLDFGVVGLSFRNKKASLRMLLDLISDIAVKPTKDGMINISIGIEI